MANPNPSNPFKPGNKLATVNKGKPKLKARTNTLAILNYFFKDFNPDTFRQELDSLDTESRCKLTIELLKLKERTENAEHKRFLDETKMNLLDDAEKNNITIEFFDPSEVVEEKDKKKKGKND